MFSPISYHAPWTGVQDWNAPALLANFILAGEHEANERETKSCLSQLFHFKLVSSSVMKKVHEDKVRTCLKLKTLPRFQSSSLSLSMAKLK